MSVHFNWNIYHNCICITLRGRIKGKAGIQLKCIPEKRDTNKVVSWENGPFELFDLPLDPQAKVKLALFIIIGASIRYRLWFLVLKLVY